MEWKYVRAAVSPHAEGTGKVRLLAWHLEGNLHPKQPRSLRPAGRQLGARSCGGPRLPAPGLGWAASAPWAPWACVVVGDGETSPHEALMRAQTPASQSTEPPGTCGAGWALKGAVHAEWEGSLRPDSEGRAGRGPKRRPVSAPAPPPTSAPGDRLAEGVLGGHTDCHT